MNKSQFFEKIFLDFLQENGTIIIYNQLGGMAMLEYKIDIISELSKVGINTTTAKNTGIFGQETMKKFKEGNTKISLDNLNRLCAVLEMQPRDIIKYIETDEDREKYISKICEK